MDLDYGHYLQFFFALIFVIALIGLVAVIMRHYGLGGAIKFGQKFRNGRRRLSVVEAIPVDARRRLLLIKRDDVEHLILFGTHQDLLIENGIISPLKSESIEDESLYQDSGSNPIRTVARYLRNGNQWR